MGYQMRYGNMERRRWRSGCGKYEKIWRREGWNEWREGVIVPIVKKGEGNRVEEYREVTLTQTAYKMYVAVLA